MLRRLSVAILLTLLLGAGCSQDSDSTVTGIVILYVDWDIMTVRDWSCDDLMSMSITKRVEISDPEDVKRFVALGYSKDFGPVRREYDGVDTRICCVMSDRNGETVQRISFGIPGMMDVDGAVYKTDPELFQFVLTFLPEGYLDTGQLGK